MPYDPNEPQPTTPLDAVQMRGQLTGLKAIIDAILTLTAAQVDGVSAVEPGNPANASVNVNGNTWHFTFDIPRGNDGAPGEVSLSDLNNAISNAVSDTSHNTNAVSTLDTAFADPDVEALRQAYNTLVLELRR